MEICGIEKLSLVDFEGHMACTLFTAKCNFRCPFCHNAPLISGNNDLPPIAEDEILDYLEKRKNILDAVCISGGEPTLESDLPSFAKKIKALGYLIKLDTNGTRPEIIEKLYKEGLIDYVAMDIKSGLKGYPLATGTDEPSRESIKRSVNYLINCGIKYEFRTTLVYELHSLTDIEEMTELLAGAKKLYLQRFVDSGNCIAEGLSEVDEKTARLYKTVLEKTIETVELRNY